MDLILNMETADINLLNTVVDLISVYGGRDIKAWKTVVLYCMTKTSEVNLIKKQTFPWTADTVFMFIVMTQPALILIML